MKICFIVCWFGKLPEYVPVWFKSVSKNTSFDFLLVTDAKVPKKTPKNVKKIPFDKELFLQRAKRIIDRPCLNAAYKLCDYRPMYGEIFKEEIVEYDYWGYCDLDVVFGDIEKFLPEKDIKKYDAIFNGGHFTLIKNTKKMNTLYKRDGALFNYKTVVKKNAVFAFDETTGIHRIARVNNVTALWEIPYVDADAKYTQLRSRMNVVNPDYQTFYWENGKLYRAKYDNGACYYQEIVYIHLQKRSIFLLDKAVAESDAFWIEPNGFRVKKSFGFPNKEEISEHNPFNGIEYLNREKRVYRKKKIKMLVNRGLFSIYVRLRQQCAGINNEDGMREELPWVKY